MRRTAAVLASFSLLFTARSAMADEPAYALSLTRDLPVIAASTTIAGSWFLRDQLGGPTCAPVCDRSKLWAIDRASAGNYSEGFRRSSDVGIGALVVAATTVVLVDEGFGNGVSDMVVVGESVVVTNALTALANFAAHRPRPLAYGDKAPLDERTRGNAAMSFVSGHTGGSFALTMSTFETLRRLHPSSAGPYIALAVGVVASSFVGVTRVLAGDHHPTDVIAGAVVGASIGTLVPSLHERGASVSLGPTGLSIAGVF